MNPRIVGVAGPFQGKVFSLSTGPASIGRESSNHLWVDDPALSRRHCVVDREEPDGFTIRDLGSRNGTIVNGGNIDQQQLKHGDQISIGKSVLVFLVEEGDALAGRSAVEFSDTTEFAGRSVLLHPEEAVYPHPDQVAVQPGIARMTRDLNTLLKIAIGIGGIRNGESLQWQLLGMIFDVVPAERGAILLFDPDRAVAWDRVRGPAHAVRVSSTVLHRVKRERAGILIRDVSADEALSRTPSLDETSVCSVLCVPLIVAERVSGAIYLDSANLSSPFDESHLQVMTAIAGIAGPALDHVLQCERLQFENQELRAQVNIEHNLVGGGSRINSVFEFIRRAAPTDSTVLIQGESGTGKELVARAIHCNSRRAGQPFVAINCAAITETLLESELFGHERGAFTGASAQKKGKLENAEGGTVFLDEITELAPSLQAKLLRVLQEREVERVGGIRPIKLNIRLVAATNRSLPEAVKKASFREDLYYRLNVLAIHMPPLRERREDIPQLAEHFIAKASNKCRMRAKSLSPETMAFLTAYSWPGNVRELENALERALVMGSSEVILPDDLPEAILESSSSRSISERGYYASMNEFKKSLVLSALQQASGNYAEAAKTLGIHPNSLLRLVKNLGVRNDSQPAKE